MAHTTRANNSMTGSKLGANDGGGEPAVHAEAAGPSHNDVVETSNDVSMNDEPPVVVDETPTEAEEASDDDYVDAQEGGHVSHSIFMTKIDLDHKADDPQGSIDDRGDGSSLGYINPANDQAPLLDACKGSEKDNLRKFLKEPRRALLQAETCKPEEAKANIFREESVQLAAKRQRLDVYKVALERAKDTKWPDLYTGQSQKHLDKFLRQAESTFRTKPTVYATDEDKCIYAGQCLGEKPDNDWVLMDKAIMADPDRSHSWKAFVEMLQQDLLAKAQRQVKVHANLRNLKQRNDQSVGDFLCHLQSIEQRLEHEVPDWIGRMLVMTGVHSYLKEALMVRDCLGNTRSELEIALRSIEGLIPAPAGITVKESCNVSRGDSTYTKSTVTRRPSSNPRCSEGKKEEPSRREGYGAPDRNECSIIKCYNCNKSGHISKNCRALREPGNGKSGRL